MKMAVCTVTAEREGWENFRGTWGYQNSHTIIHSNKQRNLGVIGGMQEIYKTAGERFDVLFYTHDDVICREPNWQERVLKQFEDPKVGVVGFGGSIGHGDPDIYKKPYHISQLGRSFYMSNVDDAEVHGVRFTEVRDVATLDGFSLAVRRSLLDRLGGWPNPPGGFHCYDHAITLSAHRLGYRVRLVGIRCHHLGGQTSVSLNGADAKWHTEAHKWLFESYRDVLPVWVNQ